ncbi:MAG: sulfite exporter TauE/SafE family protein [Methylobacter sp.]|nr:sulfite exporter TauE/SafE family protein [Methylobacter sp.]
MTGTLITLMLLIGLFSGIASGMFGIGGGVIIVPALIYLAKFSQHAAIGTSLAVLLPPIGLLAVLEYYRQGNIDLKSAFIVAIAFMVGGWIGANAANHMNGHLLKLLFGIFVLGIGGYLVFDAVKLMK